MNERFERDFRTAASTGFLGLGGTAATIRGCDFDAGVASVEHGA